MLKTDTPAQFYESAARSSAQNIYQLFAEQVRKTPAAIALVSAEQQLSYFALDQKVTQLAAHLMKRGIGPENLVGVLLNRKPEMLIAVLAILKAGAAYVPLDPNYPAERIGLLVEDAEMSTVLTSRNLQNVFAGIPRSTEYLCVEEIPSSDSLRLDCPARPENLAYVIYTSGSTGKPKGVMVEQRNVLSFFRAMNTLLGFDPGVWLAVTSLSFDISVLELLWTLTLGYTVVLHGDEGTHTIADEIRRFSVTHLQSTPSLVRILTLEPRSLAALGSMRKLLLGGEALPPSLVQTVRSVFQGDLFNMYGPTETTIWSTAHTIHEIPSNVPIGKPLANTSVHILDEAFQPVLPGQVGELFIGGEGVARGYWKRSELTAERFLENRLSDDGRLYKTGDLVRLNARGELEFLGRADFQVKISGFRIELGEIESLLETLPAVDQAIVIAREDRPGDKRLVAYLTMKPEEHISAVMLRKALAEKLPPYMIPAHFVILERLPLTSNGKIDRKALPLVPTESESDSANFEPTSDLEETISTIWCEALGLPRTSADQNFFDLGASSLMVAEVHARLQQHLQQEISLVDLFQFPTVRLLAAHLSGSTSTPTLSDRASRRLAARRDKEVS
jgi:amino acid adenylation domain-containing protein